MLFSGLLALTALHIAAIFIYLLRGQNLIGPMVTGRKRVASETTAPAFPHVPVLLVGILLADAAGFGLWWLDNH